MGVASLDDGTILVGRSCAPQGPQDTVPHPKNTVDCAKGRHAMTSQNAEQTEPNVLVVDKVTRDFAGLRALDSVSLKLERGEIVGLIGPNGSGKTTLVNVVTGFLKPTEGRVLVGDVDITAWPPHKIAHLGLARTFQTIRLFQRLAVLENVEVAAVSMGMSRRQARKQAYEVLDTLGAARLADLPAGALPYGEERRIEIARALATRPSFLLLDEPGAGLAEVESGELLGMLAGIPQKMGCGMLVIDHDMSLIMRLCDRLHVLNYGRTIAEGTPEEVHDNPAVMEAYLGTSSKKEIYAGS